MDDNTNLEKTKQINRDNVKANTNISSLELAAKAAIGGVSIGTLVGSAAGAILGTPIGVGLGVSLGILSATAGFSASHEHKDDDSVNSEHE